jgi:predicted ATPase
MTSLKEFGRLATFESFWIKNFKSIRDLRLDMSSKLNIIIGTNGSGKTALVEALELLTSTLDWARGLNLNPFSRWWGYNNVVWRHDENLPITIGVKLQVDNLENRIREIIHLLGDIMIIEYLRETLINLSEPMNITYELDISGKGGRFQILRENLMIEGKSFKIHVDTAKNLMIFTTNMMEIFKSFVKLMNKLKESYEKKLETFPPELIALYAELEEIDRKQKLAPEIKDMLENTSLTLLFNISEIFSPTVSELKFACEIEKTYLIHMVFPILERNITLGTIVTPEDFVGYIEEGVLGEKCREKMVRTIRETLSFNTNSPRYQDLISKRKDLNVDLLQEIVKKVSAEIMIEYILRDISLIISIASLIVYGFIDGITILRNIDWRDVSTPQSLERQERLKSDASNFIQFFFTITGGHVDESLKEALKYAFPGYEDFNVIFEATTDGRVFMRLIADDLRLAPISIPQGVLKTLILESLLRWRPTLLVVDEFENSLHPELQQFLIDEFRYSDLYVILTTHSTTPLNYVKKVQEVIILRLENGETKAYRLNEEIAEILRNRKLTLSELISSGLLELKS